MALEPSEKNSLFRYNHCDNTEILEIYDKGKQNHLKRNGYSPIQTFQDGCEVYEVPKGTVCVKIPKSRKICSVLSSGTNNIGDWCREVIINYNNENDQATILVQEKAHKALQNYLEQQGIQWTWSQGYKLYRVPKSSIRVKPPNSPMSRLQYVS